MSAAILLVKAEALKIGRRRSTFALVAFALAAGPTAALALAAVSLLSASELPGDVYQTLVYPYSLSTAARSVVFVGRYLGVAAVATVYGAEYASRTWKMLLPRAAGRLPFLLVKDMLLVVGLTLLVAVAVAGWVGSGAAVAALVGPPADFVLEEAPGKYALPHTSLSILFVAGLSMLVYGSLAALVTIAARSAVAGLVAGSIAPTIVSFVPRGVIGFASPDTHLDNVFARVVEYAPLVERATRYLGADTSIFESLCVLLAYAAVFGVASHAIFARRDEH